MLYANMGHKHEYCGWTYVNAARQSRSQNGGVFVEYSTSSSWSIVHKLHWIEDSSARVRYVSRRQAVL